MNNQEIIQESDIKILQGVEFRLCLCGCNELVHAKDACGRVIKYKPGHNRRGKRKPKNPTVVLVNKIQSLDEAKSHLIATDTIIKLKDKESSEKDECIKCMYEYIIKLEEIIKDNSISYERKHEINECMQQYEEDITGLKDGSTW